MWASSEQFEAVKRFVVQYVSYPQGAVVDEDLLKFGIALLVKEDVFTKEGVFTVDEFQNELLRKTNTICPAEWLPGE